MWPGRSSWRSPPAVTGPLRPRADSEPALRTARHGPGLFLGPAVPRADPCAHRLRPCGRRPADGRPSPRWRSAQPRGVPETVRASRHPRERARRHPRESENTRPAALDGSQARSPGDPDRPKPPSCASDLVSRMAITGGPERALWRALSLSGCWGWPPGCASSGGRPHACLRRCPVGSEDRVPSVASAARCPGVASSLTPQGESASGVRLPCAGGRLRAGGGPQAVPVRASRPGPARRAGRPARRRTVQERVAVLALGVQGGKRPPHRRAQVAADTDLVARRRLPVALPAGHRFMISLPGARVLPVHPQSRASRRACRRCCRRAWRRS